MNEINLEDVEKFVRENIERFHANKLAALQDTNLTGLLKKKNPYLFKAKALVTAKDLVGSLLDSKLSSSEETIFGGFLEDLAIYVAEKTLNAHKSAASSVDLEYDDRGHFYLMTIKSGLNWGNSNQWKDLVKDLNTAIRVLKQNPRTKEVTCILGVCYGKARRTLKRGIINQICGQDFWTYLSGRKEFYKLIVEPLAFRASQLNAEFDKNKAQLVDNFVSEFTRDYCDEKGNILWDRIIELNSGNLEKRQKKPGQAKP
jgi:hypothetical protein